MVERTAFKLNCGLNGEHRQSGLSWHHPSACSWLRCGRSHFVDLSRAGRIRELIRDAKNAHGWAPARLKGGLYDDVPSVQTR